ncbi:helix-turn-helix transcriptional regulator [Paenisporosarcina sp. TG-14]|uniref:helix-turn-helix transcriptional regulator n=1 Tax=Paenisporosarcina sp. TG-14 TaxID=1231057 RepID=UPI0012DC84B2|nr:helix-turn-helix transcriptional regulator [Paenisporosarcina sp. TG-14]
MKKPKVGILMKEMRARKTQDQLAMDLNVSRETISKYENGRSKIPSDITRSLMSKYDNPRFAITVRNEYTKTGAVWLDGPNVDLHRSSVKEKVLEELNEAVLILSNFCMAKPLKSLQHFEHQELESVLEELIEAQTALEHMVAVICEEANISYTGSWDRHYKFLASAGYIRGLA